MKVAIESRNVGMTPRWKHEIEARMADLERSYGGSHAWTSDIKQEPASQDVIARRGRSS